MLIQIFPRLGNNLIIKGIKKFFESRLSAILIAALTLVSNIFSLEVPVLYIFAAIVATISLLCDDMLAMLPLACCAYFTFSKPNNPLAYGKDSIFLTPLGFAHIIVVASIIALFALLRLGFDLSTKRIHRKRPQLLWGFLFLGLAYVLGGLLSEYYGYNTFFFGLLQILALSFSYLFFYFAIDFKKVNKSYFAYLMCVIGFLLCGEIVGMLNEANFFALVGKGEFDRGGMYTGWGIYNNVAGAMIMCLPAPFYYATTKKHGWLFLLLANIFFVALIFTQSRGGMVFGAALYALCVLMMLIKAKKGRRLVLFLIEFVIIAATVTVVYIYRDAVMDMFNSVIDRGMDDSGRFDIYRKGFEQFLENPLFGNGFYASEVFRWGDTTVGKFLPGRYHNTIIQILACCGIIGIIAYVFHRYQTLRMLFTKRSTEKYFIFLCILGLLFTSFLDCHFFNFGPGFTYSALLLFMEIDHLRKEEELPSKINRYLKQGNFIVLHPKASKKDNAQK